ncbi:MAG: restriction endonuclease subunit S [Candidatus Muirbacterium halophilum]|nr:restriction endonuclease subunit S [Candidatus Muirbacterium halophilum]MCK9476665.1 restriction endonuclease subunit S [Candidatus Muirbacterium halophilum]
MENNKYKEDIPNGYKFVKGIGVIPEDWEVKNLKEICKIITGKTPSTYVSENYGGYLPFVTPVDLSENKNVKISERYISERGLKESKLIPKYSVLVTCIGSTIGKLGFNIIDVAINQQINAILPFKYINNEYIFYFLKKISGRIKNIACNQAVPIINKTELGKFNISLPFLHEQNRIAECLSLLDKQIEMEENILNKFIIQKKGLMQNLLVGKIRFPEFRK